MNNVRLAEDRRRQWHPTPVFLPGKSQGRGSLVGCHLWGRTELDTTEATQQQQQQRATGNAPRSSQGERRLMKNVFNYRALLLPGPPKLGATAWMAQVAPKQRPSTRACPSVRIEGASTVAPGCSQDGALGCCRCHSRPAQQAASSPGPTNQPWSSWESGAAEDSGPSLRPPTFARPESSATCSSPPSAPGDPAPRPGVQTTPPCPATRAQASSHTRSSQSPGLLLFPARFHSVPASSGPCREALSASQRSPSRCGLLAAAFGLGLLHRNRSFLFGLLLSFFSQFLELKFSSLSRHRFPANAVTAPAPL